MTNKDRLSVIKKCRNKSGWYSGGEVVQEKIIKEECEKEGFEFSNFWQCDGKWLLKRLNHGIN